MLSGILDFAKSTQNNYNSDSLDIITADLLELKMSEIEQYIQKDLVIEAFSVNSSFREDMSINSIKYKS
jgi:hypothetical protein